MGDAVVSPTEFARYRSLLIDEGDELNRQLLAVTAELDVVLEARSDVSADDEHDPDGSTLSSDWSRISGLARGVRKRRAEVERAIGRIEDGRYGTCERCGRPIGAGRLGARPAAEHCIDCARELGL